MDDRFCFAAMELTCNGPEMSLSTMKRLSILQGHLESGSSVASTTLEAFTVSAEIAPQFSGGAGSLTIVDNRTGKKYEIPISEGGTVKATDFKKVRWIFLNFYCRSFLCSKIQSYISVIFTRKLVTYAEIIRTKGMPCLTNVVRFDTDYRW